MEMGIALRLESNKLINKLINLLCPFSDKKT